MKRTPSCCACEAGATTAASVTLLKPELVFGTQANAKVKLGCIGCGGLSLDKCALYNREDRAARHGPGPRYLMGDKQDEP